MRRKWGKITPTPSTPTPLRTSQLLRAMGFLVSQHGHLGAIPPPPFLGVSPLESMRSGGAIPLPLKRGISAIPARYPMKTRQMGAIPPSAIVSRKGIAPIGGGISHWAAKLVRCTILGLSLFQRKTKGVENSGEGKTYHKNPSQKRFWTPPPMIRFVPCLFSPCCFP